MKGGSEMQSEARSLSREIRETLLLLGIAGLTLAGYVGMALLFVSVVR